MAEAACRLDVWLWRARFFKSRSAAAGVVEAGRIRLTRAGIQSRAIKASRAVMSGDDLVFVLSGRVRAIRVLALGERRGPPTEARALYEDLPGPD